MASSKKKNAPTKAALKKVTKTIDERDGAGRVRRRWLHDSNGRIVEMTATGVTPTAAAKLWNIPRIRQILFDAFLPIGYPDSVTPDYLGYQTFDSLQAFFSTITSLLANRAILQGLGVGDANSSATYALLLTILKDGISRVATIAFAYRFGLVIEPECKKYRFLADIFNDSAFFLDLFSPLFAAAPKVVALVVAEALRAMCGVAAGASKAALSKHFARRNNLSELNAKESSQETAVGLLGLLVGSVVVRHVESREAVFALMVVLVFVHLGMNYLGVRCVQLAVLNQQRATILFEHYLDAGRVLSPAQVAERESVVVWNPVVRVDTEPVAKIVFAGSYADAMVPGAVARDFELEGHVSFRLCLCRRGDALPFIKILLFGDPSQLPLEDTTTLRAWFAAVALAHAPGLKLIDAIPEDNRARLVLQEIEKAGWSLAETNLDSSAPWMAENGQGKKEL